MRLVWRELFTRAAFSRSGASKQPESTDKEVKNAASINKYRLSRKFRFPPFG
jgi:hypothetical protein